jgi:hypothetical protein
MRRLRRLALFVFFAIVGSALAVCVGYSTDKPRSPKLAEDNQGALHKEKSEEYPSSSGPAATFVPDSSITGMSSVNIRPSPCVAEPYPRVAQQFTAQSDKSTVEALVDILSKQLSHQAASPQASQTAAPQTAPPQTAAPLPVPTANVAEAVPVPPGKS